MLIHIRKDEITFDCEKFSHNHTIYINEVRNVLVEFKVENFLSFKEEVTFSNIASTDKSLPNNVINLKKNKRYLRNSVIYGPNASGKTNLIKALDFVKFIVINSHTNQSGQRIERIPFKLDKNYFDKPSKFEISFIWEKILYIYGFSLTEEKIHEEYLYSYPKGQPALIFERNGLENEYHFTTDEKEQKDIAKHTLENMLYISRSANMNYEKSKIAMKWFVENLTVAFPSNSRQMRLHSAEIFDENNKIQTQMKELLCKLDTGIIDLDLTLKKYSKENTPDEAPDGFKKMVGSLYEKSAKIYNTKINTIHNGKDENGKDVPITFDFEREESRGTIKLFDLSGQIFESLMFGKVLVYDEFDNSLHPHLLSALIKIYNDPDLNKNNAQLIFTTHNTNLLTQTLFRRDQIWFTEKNQDQSTNLFSLSEYNVRKDKNIERGYLSGRYGAIPFISDGEY